MLEKTGEERMKIEKKNPSVCGRMDGSSEKEAGFEK